MPVIADLLVGLTDARKTWGIGLCFLHLRNVKGHPWNNKRVYRIYCELELIKPRMRRKRDKPDAQWGFLGLGRRLISLQGFHNRRAARHHARYGSEH